MRSTFNTLLKSASISIFAFFIYWPLPGLAQSSSQTVTKPTENSTSTEVREIQIDSIQVNGVGSLTEVQFLIQTSGLKIGQFITIPGDLAFSDAIRDIYRLGKYKDVKLLEEEVGPNSSTLIISVEETPRLGTYGFEGIKKSHRSELKDMVPLLSRTPLKQTDIERSQSLIKAFYAEKGFATTEVTVEHQTNPDGTVDLTFFVARGKIAEIQDISLQGLTATSEKKVLKQLKSKKDRWWRFWKKSKFNKNTYQEDLQRIVTYLNERGYYDARILRDTVYLAQKSTFRRSSAGATYTNQEGDTISIAREEPAPSYTSSPGYNVELDLYEGPQYHIRTIAWEGNTVYPDAVLSHALGFRPGDVYNGTQLQENLFANRSSTDVSSLYMNKGYMTFRVEPIIRVADGDSLDLYFDVAEGDIYEFGSVEIAGNEKTKDHVVRRELYTIPGQTFSRDAIQESIRRLMQLNYFSQESLGAGPSIDVDDQRKLVDLSFNLTETGSDQLQLSGTWASYGLVLSLGFEFNNFSAQNVFKKNAWRPLPSGDGQKLSLGISNQREQLSKLLYRLYRALVSWETHTYRHESVLYAHWRERPFLL